MTNLKPEESTKFLNFVRERFGIYLDSIHGFNLNYQKIIKDQQRFSNLPPIEQMDQESYIRSNNDPPSDLKECARLVKHEMTQDQYKNNNVRGGLNHRTALKDCLCAIYNYWAEFKKVVLKNKGGTPDEEIIPVMLYIKEIRHRLTHQNSAEGKLIKSYRCKSAYPLPSFSENEHIELSENDLDAIIEELQESLEELSK